MINFIKKNKQFIFLYIFAFYFFYLPDLGFISPVLNSSVVLAIIDTILFIINRKKVKQIFFDKFFIVLFTITLYTLIVTIINGNPIYSNLTGFVIFLKSIYFLFMIYYLSKSYREPKSKINFIINVGNIQAFICIIMLIVPYAKEIANWLYISNFPNYYLSSVVGITSYRIYGITSDYTFSLSIFMSMIAALSFFMFIDTKKGKYLLSSVVCLISSILNGRTGTVIFIIVIILLLIINWKKSWINKKNILIAGVFVFLVIVLLISMKEVYFVNWILTGFREIISLINGSATGTFNVLLNNYLFIPDTIINFIFGEGGRVYGEIGQIIAGRSSDIGYVNDLFRGGIVYCIIYYSSILWLLNKLYMKAKLLYEKKYAFSLVTIIFIYFAISNFKGEALGGSSILFLGLYVIYVYKGVGI